MESKTNKLIYVDNAATTPVAPHCLNAMMPFFTKHYGNPSSLYSIAKTARSELNKAREISASCIGAEPEEIYFTSSGSEGNTWALTSTAKIKRETENRNKILTTNIEHHSILNTCKHLEKEGFKIVQLPVDSEGLIYPEQVANAIDGKTALVSIMTANNEIGTIMPIEAIAKVCKQSSVLFHTDAVQAIGHLPIDVSKQGIDLLTMSGHKIGAPKGIGLLYVKKNVPLQSLIFGGGQERSKRAGTENVAFAVGLAECLNYEIKNMEQKEQKLKKLQSFLLDGVLNSIKKVKLNGSLTHRLSNNLNFSFEGIEGESILLMLDEFGICASSGSACASSSLEPSHVLRALGVSFELAHSSLRISLSEHNTKQDMETILQVLPKIIETLRNMSPIWKK